MRAFHVVGVNFQLRLGVGGRVVGEQQIFVRLLRVGLLRDGMNVNPSVENALRFVVEDAVEILVAGAMRLRVLDNHVMIGQLLAAREVKAVQNAFQAFAGEFGADVVARKLRAERERMDVHIAGAAKFAGNGRHVKCVQRLVLEFHVLQRRVVAGDNFRDGIGEIRGVVGATDSFQ